MDKKMGEKSLMFSTRKRSKKAQVQILGFFYGHLEQVRTPLLQHLNFIHKNKTRFAVTRMPVG